MYSEGILMKKKHLALWLDTTLNRAYARKPLICASKFGILYAIINSGRVAEWPIASVSKTDSPAMVTGVRLPPLPNYKEKLRHGHSVSCQGSLDNCADGKSYLIESQDISCCCKKNTPIFLTHQGSIVDSSVDF